MQLRPPHCKNVCYTWLPFLRGGVAATGRFSQAPRARPRQSGRRASPLRLPLALRRGTGVLSSRLPIMSRWRDLLRIGEGKIRADLEGVPMECLTAFVKGQHRLPLQGALKPITTELLLLLLLHNHCLHTVSWQHGQTTLKGPLDRTTMKRREHTFN